VKKILFVAATADEADIVKKIPSLRSSWDGFYLGDSVINTMVTGVGSVATSWSLTKWFCSNDTPDLVINIGIAGSFNRDIPIGAVVVPVSDCFADAGIESGDRFFTLAEAGLQKSDSFPFKDGKIFFNNEYIDKIPGSLRKVNAVTVNMATGSVHTAAKIQERYKADIESMEGAAFAFVCSSEKVNFLALRSISNYVGPRQKEKWDIGLALENLSETIKSFLSVLS